MGDMVIQTVCEYNKSIIKLFNKHEYERHIQSLMNLSKKIFLDEYSLVEQQSNGECDFIGRCSGLKFDAKLPFEQWQIKLLVNGKKSEANVMEWLKVIKEESVYDPIEHRNNPLYIQSKKLYRIMYDQIYKDNQDENIVFFIPYPIVISDCMEILGQFASDYLDAIYAELEKNLNMSERNIYVIFPSTRKNQFVLRKMKKDVLEYVDYVGMEDYFTYESYFVKYN